MRVRELARGILTSAGGFSIGVMLSVGSVFVGLSLSWALYVMTGGL